MHIQLLLNFEQEQIKTMQSALGHADQEKIITMLVQMYLDFIRNEINKETGNDDNRTQ